MAHRTIRGAITTENTTEAMLADTKAMLNALIEENNLSLEDITAIWFTATVDLNAAYPAVAARAMGITQASLMCAQEMAVEGSLPLCLRCMVSIESPLAQSRMKHVYLKDAAVLRPDLSKGNS